MKKIIFVLACLMIAGAAHADMTDLGYGLQCGCSYSDVSEPYFSLGGNNLYFQAEYPGYATFSLDAVNGVQLYALNGTPGSEVGYSCGSGSFSGRNTTVISCASNEGIYYLASEGFYPASSAVSYGAHDYSHRTYVGGSSYVTRVLNRFLSCRSEAPQYTSFVLYPSLAQIEFSTNDSSSYFALLKASCSTSGAQQISADNFGGGKAQDYGFYAYFVPASSINFTSATYDDGASVSTPSGVPINFTVTSNHPEALTGVAWYVDGGLAEDAAAPAAKIMTYSFKRSVSKVYHVEVQIEDVTCQTYKTIGWYVTVGTSATLQGVVYDNSSFMPIEGADVVLSCLGASLETTTTALNGSYVLTGLVGGKTYDVAVSKTGYSSAMYSPTFNASFTYGHDFYLVPSSVVSGSDALRITDLVNLSSGQSVYVYAYYTHGGVMIPGASCWLSSSDLDPSYTQLSPLYGPGGSVVAYSSAEVVGSSVGNKSYTVSCSASGFLSLSSQDYFMVGNTSTPALVSWVAIPSSVIQGQSAVVRVQYATSSGGAISGATCTAHFNSNSYPMLDQGVGIYTLFINFATVASYQVYVDCSLTSYGSASTSMRSLVVVSNQSSSTSTTLPPGASCFDGVLDGSESSVDCGGSCSPCVDGLRCYSGHDCVSGYCASHVCFSPSCFDGAKNGDETGLDCGGSCPSCICFNNWDCAGDGSESCILNQCIRGNCSSNPDCPDIYWRSPAVSGFDYFMKSRECFQGHCRFVGGSSSQNGSNLSGGSLSVDVIPKTSFSFSESNRTVYVMNCVDGSNYFTVRTNIPSLKWYSYVDPVYYAPYVPASSYVIWDAASQLSASGPLPALCEIPAGGDHVFAEPCFQVSSGSSVLIRCIYVLSYRDAFRVEALPSGTDGVQLNLTRAGTCFSRNLGTDSWTAINAVPSTLWVWSVDPASSYRIRCNNSYGETASFDYKFRSPVRGAARTFALFIWDFIASIGAALWFAVFGSEFVWGGWMILLIIPVILIGCFLLLSVLFVLNRRGKSGAKG